ncbi:hypothetical protein J6590_099715, partial [Homalodisca vitripennis]
MPDPNEHHADGHWNHWKATFENFTEAICAAEESKLKLLINFVNFSIHELLSGADS